MTRNEALEKAKEKGSNLTAYDFLSKYIEILHQDGSKFIYNYACYEEIDDQWCAIFSEHNGFNVFCKSDIEWIKEWNEPNVLYWNNEDGNALG